MRCLIQIFSRKVTGRTHAWMAAALFMTLALIVSLLSYTAQADRDLSQQVDQQRSVFEQQAQRVAELQRMKAKAADCQAQAKTDAAMVDATPPSRVLADIANAIVPGIQIQCVAIGQETPDRALKIQHPGSEVRITLTATSDAVRDRFLANLRQEHCFATIAATRLASGPAGVEVIASLDSH